MGVGGSEGTIFADIQLSLAAMQAQVDRAVALSGQVGKALTGIPEATPKLNTAALDANTTHAMGLAQSLALAFGPQLTASFGQTEQLFAKASGGLVNLGAASAIATGGITAIVAASAAAGGALLHLGEQYATAFRALAVQTGETGDGLQRLQTSLENLGQRSGAGIEKLGAVMTTVRQHTGELGNQLETTTLAMFKFAKATGTDAVESTNNLLRIFNAFHVAVTDQQAVLDAFVQIAQKTGISQKALQEEVQATGATLRGYGLDAQQAAAFIGLLDKAGIKAEPIVAGLRRALGNITGPNAKEQLFGLIDDLGSTDDRLLATTRATELFGQKSAAALLDLARNGGLSLDKMDDLIVGSEGAAKRAADAQDSSWRKVELAIGRAANVWAPTAEAMADALAKFVDDAVSKFETLGQAIDTFLASDRVRAMVTFLLTVQKGVGAAATGTIPERTIEPTPAQAEGALGLGAQAAGVAAVAGLTEAERALVLEHQARIRAEEELLAHAAALQAANAVVVDSIEAVAVTEEMTATTTTKTAAERAAATQRVLDGLLKAKEGVVDYAAALKLGSEGHTAFVESTLREQQASDHLAASIAAVTDLHEKATAIVLQRAAADATGAERAALFAQAEEVARAGTDSRIAGLSTLAGALLPSLSAAEARHITDLQNLKDPQAVATALANKYGISLDELNSKLAGTGTSLAEFAKQQAAAARPLAEFVSDETKGRITSALGALASGTDAATAAQAKQLAESGHQAEALELLASKYGVGKEQAAAWAEAVKQGGGAAQLAAVQMQLATAITGEMGKAIFAAKEQLSALTTFARDPQTGTIRLKVDIDIDAAKKAIYDLQQSFVAANQDRANAESKATHEFSIQQQAVAEQQNQVRADYKDSVAQIAAARTASSQQLGRDLAAAATASNTALASVSASAAKAQSEFQSAVNAAATTVQVAFLNAQKTYQDGVKALQDQTNQAIDAAASAQAGALRALSSAMTSFNQQQVQTAFTASVAAQNAQLAALPGLDQTSVGGVTNSARVAAIQAAGQAGITQANASLTLAQAQDSVAQQQLTATKALTKALDDAAKQMAALADAQKNTQNAALVQGANAQTAAARALGISQIGQVAYDATHAQAKTVLLLNGVPYVVDTDTLHEGPPDLQPGGTVGAQAAALAAGQAARNTAFDADRQRQKALDDQAAAQQQKHYNQLIQDAVERGQDPFGLYRTKAERAFDQAEIDRQQAQRDADKKYLEDKKKADDTLDALLALKASISQLPGDTAEALTERFNAAPQEFFQGAELTVQETEVDFLANAIGRYGQRVRSRT